MVAGPAARHTRVARPSARPALDTTAFSRLCESPCYRGSPVKLRHLPRAWCLSSEHQASHAYPGSVVNLWSSTGIPIEKWYRLCHSWPDRPSTSCIGSS